MTARSSSDEAQATASTLAEVSSTITLASIARPAARATSGSPAPDSTASETAPSASRPTGPLRVLVIRPHDGQSDPGADAQQRHEDEQRQEAGGELLPDAAVALPGGSDDQRQVAGADDAGRYGEGDLDEREVEFHGSSLWRM